MALICALSSWLSIAILIIQVACLPKNHTDDQVNAAIDAGTFQNPSVQVRPRFRYWIPDASVNQTRIALDIAEARAAGAGGVEILGYYLYDSAPGEFVPVNWEEYGWGTPAWKEVFDTAIKAHQDHGLIMDFAMGPNQGQGVPAEPDDDGLMWDLDAFNITVPVGGSFNGTVPGWGTGPLQAVVTGLVTASENRTGLYPALPNDAVWNRTEKTLAAATLEDITDQVGPDGQISLQFPDNVTGIEYTIFAFYLVREHYRNEAEPITLLGPQTVATDFVHNGSWTVDHFSAQGAQTMIDFWNNYLLINGTKEALMAVGNYAWEDSIEILPFIYWTPKLPELFEQKWGYSVNKWLPILCHQNSRVASPPTVNQGNATYTWWISDEEDAGNGHIGDYRGALAVGYGDYLNTLRTWANDYLNLQYSAQVSYNLAMDMQESIPKVNDAECESLDFSHGVDTYRQYAGPANLAGHRVVSSECGAVQGLAFQQTLPGLLWETKRSFAGSVNAFILHGYPYSGQYGNTTWPSFTTFTYRYSEMHGRHQPAWEFYSDSIDNIARHSYLFQKGVPRMDLAVYQKFTTYPTHLFPNYMGTDLETAGYSYEYLSPENFDLPQAYVANGVLAPERQGFKAMVVRANDSMTVEGTRKLAEFAHAGLPIVFSGGVPSYLVSFNTTGATYVNETLTSLTNLTNVHIVPYEGLADSIAALGVSPSTKISASNGTWYTYWRYDESLSADYVFVYDDAQYLGLGNGYGEATIEFASTGIPYSYDAWTGEQTPIVDYTQSNSTTTLKFQLAGNQSTIVAFLPQNSSSPDLPNKHITSTSGNILGSAYSNSTGLTLKVGAGDSDSQATTSDGSTHPLNSTTAEAYTLRNWNLTVEHWTPPSDLYNIEPEATKFNTSHTLPELISWQNISGLQNVSGRGYYSTTFSWPPSSTSNSSSVDTNADGAIIDFGAIFHTIRVSVNDVTLPPLDTAWARADISGYLMEGENRVDAVVATTLVNVLRPIWGELRTSGANATAGTFPPAQDYGLLGEVVVTPYKLNSL